MAQVNKELPITVIIAAKNEEANITRCIRALSCAERVIVVDSNSKDSTARLAIEHGAEVIQFNYKGGYPRKRQWALDNLPIHTDWVMLLDADEVVPESLWQEIETIISHKTADAFMIIKGFHFMGRRFRFGGFSHSAAILFRKGMARFEHIIDEPPDALDMEVHERLLIKGKISKLKTPLIHEDLKGLEAYIARQNYYSTWEAKARYQFLRTGTWGKDSVRPHIFGNIQDALFRFGCIYSSLWWYEEGD